MPPCSKTFQWTGGTQQACCCHSRLKLRVTHRHRPWEGSMQFRKGPETALMPCELARAVRRWLIKLCVQNRIGCLPRRRQLTPQSFACLGNRQTPLPRRLACAQSASAVQCCARYRHAKRRRASSWKVREATVRRRGFPTCNIIKCKLGYVSCECAVS